VRDRGNKLRLGLLSRQTGDPFQRELLLRLEIGERPPLILQLVLEFLKLPGLVLQAAYVVVETFLSIRQALLAALQVRTSLTKLISPSA
jgi:hypothetical protein